MAKGSEKMALFQNNPTEKVINRVVSLPTSAIQPNPSQPRKAFDEYALTRLAVSIRQNGVLQPLTVQREGSGYRLVAGERRLRAAKLVNLDYVPCIIVEADERQSAVLAIMENIQRADLNFFEEAEALRQLIECFGMTQDQIALQLGMAQSTVANKLRLLKLEEKDRALIMKYGLNERHARALLRLPPEKREEAVTMIYTKQLNSSKTDMLVTEMLEQRPHKTIVERNRISSVGIYINTLNKAIDAMKQAGIKYDLQKQKTDDFLTYTVRIPLK